MPGPVLLDEETWTKIEELVKTESSSATVNRKKTFVFGFLAGLIVAVLLNLVAPKVYEAALNIAW